MKKYRYEIKYIINDIEAFLIRDRLNKIMSYDENGENGEYLIKSLYFDDIYDSCFYDVESGLENKTKFRIRRYNDDISILNLEKKEKKKDLVYKEKTHISEDFINSLLHENCINNFKSEDKLKNELLYNVMYKKYHPVIIVEYSRIAYTYNISNVRITIDKDIKSSNDVGNFLGDYKYKIPVMGTGTQLLEVKFDTNIPNFIYECLDISKLEQTSFSKYYLCRKFNRTGELI